MKKQLSLLTFLLAFNLPAVRADHFPIQVDDFEILEIRTSGKIDWTSNQPGGSVDCSASLFPELEFEQNGKKLTINWKNNGRPEWKSGTNKLAIHLSSELLRKVVISGSADLEVKGINKTPEFTLDISGSGNFRANIDCSGKLALAVAGSGSSVMAGNCGSLSARISGSGDFQGRELKTEKANVRISGSGNAEVFVSQELDAGISGSGDIRYWGNPETVNKKVSGSGEVKKGV